MKWQGRRGSSNIEDRRGRRGGSTAAIGGAGGIGLVVIVVIGYFLGVDLTPLLDEQQQSQQGGGIGAPAELTEADRRAGEFVSVTLADTEEVWAEVFPAELGRPYEPVTLVLFKGVTASPCGNASGATGPFYCSLDKKVYLDTAFFTTLSQRMGAGGDFAAAYVVAHEVAHHVQDEIGILKQANQLRARLDRTRSNAVSVMLELQADCLAGVWARHAEMRLGTLEEGDVAEAMNAARQVGDDTLQRSAGRVPQPHTFSHGSAEQRERWFFNGYRSGSVGACDTFGAETL